MADYSRFLRNLHNCNVLGVNPPVQDFAFFDLWAKPLGLLYILETLRQQGNSITLLDCISESAGKRKTYGRTAPLKTPISKPKPYENVPRRFYHFGTGKEAFLSRLRDLSLPDIILVTSMMTYWYPGVFWAISLIKEVFPKVPVMLGGIYARLCPEHARKSGADMIQTSRLDLNMIRPAVELYPAPGYAVSMTSFGCPMNCGYCASSFLWPDYTARTVEEVTAEIRHQVKAAAGTIQDTAFYDDALLMDRESRFYPLCENFQRDFPTMRFHTPNGLHVRMIDSLCGQILKSTGFKTLRLSFEGTDRTLRKTQGEKTDLDSFASAVNHLRKAGYLNDEIETYVLLGLPGQRPEDMEGNIQIVKDIGVKVKTAQYSPIPQTRTFQEAALITPEIMKEPLLQNNTVYSSYVSKTLGPETLQHLKDLARST
ncbi:MAG: B12-binding domain-containing radical SAM protein [Thermovirgaceae bacterium]